MIKIPRRAIVPVWLLGDLLLVVVAYFLSIQIRASLSFGLFQAPIPAESMVRLNNGVPVFLFGYLAAAYLNGLLNIEIFRHKGRVAVGAVFATLVHVILLSSFYYFIGHFSLPRSILLTIAIVEPVLLFIWRVPGFSLFFEVKKTAVITIGPKAELLEFNQYIQREGAHFALEQWFSSYAEALYFFQSSSLSSQSRWVVLSGQMMDQENVPDFFKLLHYFKEERFEDIYILPNTLQVLLAGPNLKSISDYPLIPLLLMAPSVEQLLYRFIDLVLAMSLLALFSPVLILAILAVKLSSPGPVIFKQKRVGLLGQNFFIFKLRTMIHDAEVHTGPCLSFTGDKRVLPVGRIMRKFRIDELPQLINVLRGEMTFFGPRPERPEFVSLLSGRIPGYESRHFIRPGITGLAQIVGDYHTDAKRKLIFDLRHLSRNSIIFRADLFVRTVKTILTAVGE